MWVPGVPEGVLEPPQPRLPGRPHDLLDLGAPRRPVDLLVGGEAAPRPPLSLPHREFGPWQYDPTLFKTLCMLNYRLRLALLVFEM